ncbi:metalloregulator ArsR/SmtB family transcription factor [Arsenicicoccus piscis]|nr:metalloregulator ArsR/SmtB family transcription factor [Arsenicicoccus piscis]MCH8628418.1 metalloregulator ArsR/SmtB family transcription factor [Arsenicicoccus piscis]
MSMKAPRLDDVAIEVAPLEPVALLFRSFADPNRLAIVQHLLLGEHRVADLTDHLGLAQSTVSAHVACLRDCGLLATRVRGRSTYYSLAEPELTGVLLSGAEALLAATGDAVVPCPTSGPATGLATDRQVDAR